MGRLDFFSFGFFYTFLFAWCRDALLSYMRALVGVCVCAPQLYKISEFCILCVSAQVETLDIRCLHLYKTSYFVYLSVQENARAVAINYIGSVGGHLGGCTMTHPPSVRVSVCQSILFFVIYCVFF